MQMGRFDDSAKSDLGLLLIDDDPDMVAMVSEALKPLGWHVTVCADTARVRELVVKEQPHAVLLDIYLHHHTRGWTVLQTLIDDEDTRDVPVIVFTGHVSELERKEAWLLDHQIGVLSKPFELEDLYDAIEEFRPSRVAGSGVESTRRSTAASNAGLGGQAEISGPPSSQ